MIMKNKATKTTKFTESSIFKNCKLSIAFNALGSWKIFHRSIPSCWSSLVSVLRKPLLDRSLCTRSVSCRKKMVKNLKTNSTKVRKSNIKWNYHSVTCCRIVYLCIQNNALGHIHLSWFVNINMTNSICTEKIKYNWSSTWRIPSVENQRAQYFSYQNDQEQEFLSIP